MKKKILFQNIILLISQWFKDSILSSSHHGYASAEKGTCRLLSVIKIEISYL